MRAATMTGVREPLQVMELPDPECPANGAIVRVEANGVCRSDWHGWVGDWTWIGVKFAYPHVLGHEFCGVIEEVGPEVRRFKAGDRVIVPFAQGEGSCDYCRAGDSNVCPHGSTPGFSYWGGFGRYSAVPAADTNLVAMPDEIDFLQGAAMGCRFMTAFRSVADRGRVQPGEWVAVHGCGGIGLSATQIATALGANVIAVDIDDEKLAFAERQGAVATLRADQSNDVAKEIRAMTKGGAHVAVDALGIAATCNNAIRSLRPRGRHLQIGQTGAEEQGQIAFPVDVMLGKELTVIASSGLPPTRYGAMLAMVTSGKLKPQDLVTGTIALEETGTTIAAMDSYATLGFVVIDRY